MELDLNRKILSDIVFFDKYARYLEDKKRRETYEECIDRNKAMHLKKFPQLADSIEKAYSYVYKKIVLPSMRSLQFAGKAIELNNMRLFNCAYCPIDNVHAFSETMLLLLGGTGVGYSVQSHHVNQLPTIKKIGKEYKYLVQDSIEGWADAIKVLMRAYFEGKTKPRFDYSHIRPKGARLITSGGKAPGAEPLRVCLAYIESILENKSVGSKLTTLECHSILCRIADAVLAGGIRRAAMIAFFDKDDLDMLYCKSGNWFEINPHYGRANNSAIFLRGRDTEEDFKSFWNIVKNNKTGEPGIFWTNDLEVMSNPCVSGDTWINTSEGLKQAKELVNKDIKIINNGKIFNTKSNGFFKTGKKELFHLITKDGYNLKATKNHKILTTRGWIELKDLIIDHDEIILQNHRDNNNNNNNFIDQTSIDYKKGYLVGACLGDGYIAADHSYAEVAVWTTSITDYKGIKNQIENCLDILNTKSDFKGFRKENIDGKIICSCKDLATICLNYFDENKKLNNEKLISESRNFLIGFLKGLFDADGSVQGIQKKGVSIRLRSIYKDILNTIQIILNSLGIQSTIYKNRNGDKSFYRLLPNSKKEQELYLCQPSHELVISNNSILYYNQYISFADTDKQLKLNKILSLYKRSLNESNFKTKIESIKSLGIEEVFDVTIDTKIEDYQAFDANGIYVHNCNEASLKSFTFCNLCEINATLISNQQEYIDAAWAASFIGTLQASYTDFHYLRPIWRERTEQDALIGVGITGIANKKFLSLDHREAAETINITNKEVAKIIGIRRAARCTLIKPSGTTSSALGCSSGIHDWHDNYYIRRLRIGKNQDLYWHLLVNHPELVENDVEKPHLQAIISIPIKAPEGALIRSSSTPIDILERVKEFYEQWIAPGYNRGENSHTISVTVNIKDNEWDEVGNWMWLNRESYGGIATIPYDGGSYRQMPFESISRELYDDLSKNLHMIDLTLITEELDNTDLTGEAACAGGACAI